MMRGNGGGGSGWDYYDIIHPNSSQIHFNNHRKGTCRFRLPDKTLCGAPFSGPPNRKYCSEHSTYTQYTGILSRV
jgi:hypothetical protein